MDKRGHPAREIDACMNPIVQWINKQGYFRTLGSCCGHGKYSPTIVVVDRATDQTFEWFSGVILPRHYKNGRVRHRFYKRDLMGRYFIETECISCGAPIPVSPTLRTCFQCDVDDFIKQDIRSA